MACEIFVCLGWGSLVWSPGDLPISGDWQEDGPSLPIEFARHSSDGRITLVIETNAEPIPVLWTQLQVQSIEDARIALAQREGVCLSKFPRSIGHWTQKGLFSRGGTNTVDEWAKAKCAVGVVWTELLPRFGGKQMVPSCNQVVDYLRSRDDLVRGLAEEYVRKAPLQIQTAYRKAIEDSLGWTTLVHEK